MAPGTEINHIYSSEDKIAASIGFMQYPELYKELSVRESYENYIFQHSLQILPFIFKMDMAKGLQILIDLKIVRETNFEEKYLIPAQKNNAIQCIAALIKWRFEQ